MCQLKLFRCKYGDSKARIVTLQRRKKQRSVQVVIGVIKRITIKSFMKPEIWTLELTVFMFPMKDVACPAKSAKVCVILLPFNRHIEEKQRV